MGTISLKNKRVLVTGGQGYLGTFLVKALQIEEAQVFVLSRNAKNLPNHYAVDLTDYVNVQKAIEEIKPQVVFHLAASISRSRDFAVYDNMANVNVTATLNILRALQNISCHFIFTSSSEIYGNNLSPFNEKLLPQPASPYSLTKVQAEFLIQNFCTIYKKPFTIMRLFNFYGPSMPEDFFIPQMIAVLQRDEDFLMTKGEQTRDFLYIDDIITALLLAAQNTNAYNETFNVCSGEATKLNELAIEIGLKIKSKGKIILGALPYRENEVWEMLGDSTKIKDKLGFIPQVNLKKGVKRMLHAT